jgi:hypothetical protein
MKHPESTTYSLENQKYFKNLYMVQENGCITGFTFHTVLPLYSVTEIGIKFEKYINNVRKSVTVQWTKSTSVSLREKPFLGCVLLDVIHL